MYARYTFFAVVLLLASGIAACSNDVIGVLTGPTTGTSAFVAAEPSVLSPEFADEVLCRHGSPFGLRIVLVVGGGSNLFLRQLRFSLIDRSGAPTVPSSVLTLGSSSFGTRAGSPVAIPHGLTVPGSSPVPIPGSASVSGLMIAGGSRQSFPFLLEFGCDAPASGTLIAAADTTDENGENHSMEVRVPVGRGDL